MFEFQDNFLMGPKSAIENGELRINQCNASNAAEDQLEELARAVGGGKNRPTTNEGMVLIDEAPALEFDLENELTKAFEDNPAEEAGVPVTNPEPQVARETAAIETAVATQSDVADTTVAEPEGTVDFSEMIGDELERALQEEVAADGSLGEVAAVAPVTPPVPQETMTPWDAPEVVEAPKMPSTDKALSEDISETVQQSFEAPQMADYETPSQDYTDPAAVFDELQAEDTQPADTGTMHIDAVLGGAAALGIAAASAKEEVSPEVQEAPAFDPASAAELEAEIAYEISDQFGDDSVSIPEPHIITSIGGSRSSGRGVAIAVVAVALLGGGATLAWNSSSDNSGIAPTILASSEPVKIKPKNSGGKVVPNQDLAVYKTTNDAKTKNPAQKRLADKTEKPIVVASKTTKPTTKKVSADGSIIVKPRIVRTVVVKPDGTILSAVKKQPVVESSTTEIIAPVLALKPKLVSVSTEQSVAKKAPSKKVTYKAPQAKISEKSEEVAKLKPQPAKIKPAEVKPAKVELPKKVVAKKVVAKAPAEVVAKVATPSVSSPYAVQIAAQRSAGAAEKSYQSLSRRYASILSGKGVDIRKGVIKGKGTYYRVRIPAQSKEAARKLCAQLKAKGGACFVTR